MYSIVLAAAMSTAPVAPDFGGRFRGGRSGCYGCSGCSGCTGCTGCSGGGGGFLGLGLLSSSSSRYGSCCGGCSGCSGCYGSSFSMSCFGSVSCYGGCYGSAFLSGYAAVPYAAPMLPVPFAPPMAAAGVPSFEPPIAGAPALEPPLAGAPDATALPPLDAPAAPVLPPATVETTTNFATVVVSLPADAKLFVEGQEWTSDAGLPTRTFRTPPIDPGRTYYYAFKMEIVRSGRTLSQTQEARLQAGKTSRVVFTELSAGTSRSLAQFAVRTSE